MKKTILSILALATMFCAKADDKVLLTIDGEPVMQSEFLYIYEKNNQETALDHKTIDEYLDLFINFRLKVHEAEKLGHDTTEAFRKELMSYRAQALPKYMVCKSAEDSMALLSYQHLSKDRRVAHIALKCPQPTGHDSASMAAAAKAEKEVLARINDIRTRVTVGKPVAVKKGKKTIYEEGKPEDFFEVAMAESDDPSKAENRGELGWIVPFRYVWPLEKAVYETPVGGVSEVFRTSFGYHIALVIEERDHEEVHASHIMKMVPRGNDSIALLAKVKIDSIYSLLAADGSNFAEVAKANSDDKGSALRGGDLGFFSHGMMVQPFENVAFGLNTGEMSEPIQTRYGWHIILQHEKRGILPFSEMEQDIRRRMKNDERYQEVQLAFLRQIREEYNLTGEMTDDAVLKVEENHLEAKYPEFKNLMQEYHDGILLFNVSLQNVWDKASLDTTGLMKYFAEHKAEYTWSEPRYKGMVIYCKDKTTMKVVKSILKTADKDSVESYINNRVNVDSVQFARVEKGMWKKGMNGAVDKMAFKTGAWKATTEYPYVFLNGKVLKAPEEYTDERGKVTSAYQDYLEQVWVEELRAKYPVVINQEALNELKER